MADWSPHHRHQSSLEGVINFSSQPPLGTDRRAQARRRFYNIVNHFGPNNAGGTSTGNSNQYNRPLLVRLTYEYARSEEARDNFLQVFFQSLELPLDGEGEDIDLGNANLETDIRSTLFGFADYLLDNFFLPRKC